MNGFDDFDTQVSAEEYFAGWGEDEADYHADWREEQAQEDTHPDDPQGFGDGYGSAEYEDFLSQWDDDPNPYAGTYSEE
jgi:hypothetical protein